MGSVGDLDPREQFILLHYLEGESFEEIGESLSMSPKAVKQKKDKTLRKLKKRWALPRKDSVKKKFLQEMGKA